jgi:arylsulfatase A-like enzyme
VAPFLAGCPSRPKTVVYDLAARAAVAELSSPREIVLFGTPAAEPHQADGFFRQATRPGAEGFIWARADCQISFTWPEAKARALVIDIEPYRGVKDQRAQVLLNEKPVGSIAVDSRRRHRVDLPAELQMAGENRIKLIFAGTASPKDSEAKSTDDRHLAAAIYSVVVGAADDPVLMDMLGRDAPRVLAYGLEGGAPTLTQVGTSTVRYAIALPSAAELRLTPDLHPSARSNGGSASFRVTLEDAPGKERELWAGTLSARDKQPPAEVVVPLKAGNADGIVRLGLHVSGDRFAWGVWKAPRILGQRGVELLSAPAFTEEERRRGDEIRGGLGKTNVVFIILDAARAQNFGCYGYSRPTTPNIDAIAKEGVVFENAFTPAAYTLAAMSSIWTSQYADRHEDAAFGAPLSRDKLTLAELLGGQGIHTAGFITNAMAGKAKGLDRGFIEFREIDREVGSAADSFRKVLPEWFQRYRDRQFFAYVHFKEPHCPYDPPPPFDTRFGADGPIAKPFRGCPGSGADIKPGDILHAVNREVRSLTSVEQEHLVRLYDGNLAFADQEVGKIREWLQAEGLWDRTVVIVAADHGEALGEHGFVGHNLQVYEESIHIPLIVRFPAGKGGPAGKRISALVDSLDIGPTIADAFGALGRGGSGTRFHGRSLFPVMAGAPGESAVLSRSLWDRPRYALRTPRESFIYDSKTGASQLFDVAADAKQRQDRAAQQPIKAAYYREEIRAALSKMVGDSEIGRTAPPCMDVQQCENMKSLGYLPSDYPCRPCP